MGKIHPSLAAGFEWIRKGIDEGRFPRGILPVVAAAELGNEGFQAVVHNFVNTAIRSDRAAMRYLIARLSDMGARFQTPIARPAPKSGPEPTTEIRNTIDIDEDAVFEVLLPPEETEKMAMARVAGIQSVQEKTPADHEATILEGIEYARDSRVGVEGDPTSLEARATPTTIEKVRDGLAHQLSSEILWSMRASRNAVYIPPDPSHDDFFEFVASRIGMRDHVMAAWQRWPMWNRVLTDMFVDILAHGIVPDSIDSLAEQIEAEIELKGSWFHHLAGAGMHLNDIERAMKKVIPEHDEAARFKVLAEYSRFEPTASAKLMEAPRAIVSFVMEMRKLHESDPAIESEYFLSLLTPYFFPMEYDNLVSILRRENPLLKKFQLFVAENVLSWHAEPAAKLANRLTQFVKNNKQYNDLATLCARIMGFPKPMRPSYEAPEAFLAKLVWLNAEGADIAPLISTTEEQFPGAIPDDFDPGDAPPPKASPAAPASGGPTSSGKDTSSTFRATAKPQPTGLQMRGAATALLAATPTPAGAAAIQGGLTLTHPWTPPIQLALPLFTTFKPI